MISADKNKENIIDLLNSLNIEYKIEDYNFKEKNIEIKFILSKKDKDFILDFYNENKDIYTEKTEQTEKDLKEIKDIYVMFSSENMYFGKTEHDYTAINIASLYLIEIYLDKIQEDIFYYLNN